MTTNPVMQIIKTTPYESIFVNIYQETVNAYNKALALN